MKSDKLLQGLPATFQSSVKPQLLTMTANTLQGLPCWHLHLCMKPVFTRPLFPAWPSSSVVHPLGRPCHIHPCTWSSLCLLECSWPTTLLLSIVAQGFFLYNGILKLPPHRSVYFCPKIPQCCTFMCILTYHLSFSLESKICDRREVAIPTGSNSEPGTSWELSKWLCVNHCI